MIFIKFLDEQAKISKEKVVDQELSYNFSFDHHGRKKPQYGQKIDLSIQLVKNFGADVKE